MSIAVPEDPCPGSHGTPDRVVTGTFDTAVEGGYVMVPFEVGPAATRLRVKLCYDQPPQPPAIPGAPSAPVDVKHTLDLGLYEPTSDGFYDENEFRGWGGSSRPNVTITPETATVGFIPGGDRNVGHGIARLASGEWAAEIGVAAVVGIEEGDPDGSVAWRMEIFTSKDPDDGRDVWQPAPYDETAARSEPGWYKGDFHVHAEHSSPNDASMAETFDYAFGDRPAGAGLDFLTLSDYVSSRHWGEIGRFQADYPGKLIVRSAEVITYRGHINNHASATYVDHRTGPIYMRADDGALTEARAARGAERIYDGIHEGGGWAQVNHPTTFPSKVPLFATMCRGCSYEYSDTETDWSKVDSMEVQTGPAGAPAPEGNEPGPNPFTPLAIEWWDRLQRDGFDITAVGSSDSHHAGETPGGITQSPIGEATTVVFARELSEAGIQDAVRAGHAYVKFFSSDGPDLRLTAVQPDGSEAIMGDEVKAASTTLTARVMGAFGGQPRVLVVLRDGAPLVSVPVPTVDFSFELPISVPGDYRLQLQRGSAIEALTNPINLIGPSTFRTPL